MNIRWVKFAVNMKKRVSPILITVLSVITMRMMNPVPRVAARKMVESVKRMIDFGLQQCSQTGLLE
jgi:hypothetical protein